jgi:hypothetical protein
MPKMKLYVLDDNGVVVFEFADDSDGMQLSASQETRVRVMSLIKAVLKMLQTQEG